jgi:hypothetical protein
MADCESLLGLTFSVFDNTVGPQLKYSYPPDVITKEIFEPFADYVILSKQLSDKVMKVVRLAIYYNYDIS